MPHATIEPLGDDVDQSVVHGEINRHVRMVVRKLRKPRQYQIGGSRLVSVDADAPDRSAANAVQLSKHVLHRSHRWLQSCEQDLPGIGRSKRACGAIEQADIETRLESPHRMTERRGGYAHSLGGSGEAARLDDLCKHGEPGPYIAVH